MTPEQALQILDRAVSLAPLSRQDHQQLISAIEVLSKLIEKDQKKK